MDEPFATSNARYEVFKASCCSEFAVQREQILANNAVYVPTRPLSVTETLHSAPISLLTWRQTTAKYRSTTLKEYGPLKGVRPHFVTFAD
jgi:hypothetical protein